MRTAAARKHTKLEKDTVTVYLWLQARPGQEVSYQDISKGTGIPQGGRLQRAVRQVRATVEFLGGHRLELFRPSTDPRRKRASVTRLNLSGKGDEYSCLDAIRTSKRALTAVEDMRRSCRYEAGNVNNPIRVEYAGIADAADVCIDAVSGVATVGAQHRKAMDKNRATSRHVAQLQSELEDQDEVSGNSLNAAG